MASRDSNSVVAVDLSRFRVTAALTVDPAPTQLATRPGARELYVVSASGSVTVLAFPELRRVKRLPIGRAARDLVFSPDGRQAFVLEPWRAQLVFLNCDPLEETGRLSLPAQASGLVITPDGKTLIASASSQGRLFFVAADSRKLLGSDAVGAGAGPMVVLPDSSRVFVADTGEQEISAVDIASLQVLSHIEIDARPRALVLKPDGGELFVLGAQTVTIVDAFHDNVEQSIPTGRAPIAGVSRRDSSALYIANHDDGSVTTLDVANRTVLASTHIGAEPCALALTPDERLLAVTDCASGTLAIMRAGPDRPALLTMIPVGAMPVDVAIPGWLGKDDTR